MPRWSSVRFIRQMQLVSLFLGRSGRIQQTSMLFPDSFAGEVFASYRAIARSGFH
jgi:hypothetical protein